MSLIITRDVRYPLGGSLEQCGFCFYLFVFSIIGVAPRREKGSGRESGTWGILKERQDSLKNLEIIGKRKIDWWTGKETEHGVSSPQT